MTMMTIDVVRQGVGRRQPCWRRKVDEASVHAREYADFSCKPSPFHCAGNRNDLATDEQKTTLPQMNPEGHPNLRCPSRVLALSRSRALYLMTYSLGGSPPMR